MSEVLRDDWYQPPAGVLDGDPLEIAARYIENVRADQAYSVEHPLSQDPEHIARTNAVRLETIDLMDEYEQRLAQGDTNLAALLTRRVECEIEELNRGERSTVTGQSHLLAERLQQTGHIWGVAINDMPAG